MRINIFSIINVRFPYYDSRSRSMRFKKRPALVLRRENDSINADLTVLPVSSVTHRENLSVDYDVEVRKELFSDLNLNRDVSFIRVHKPYTVNSSECVEVICEDIRIYEDLTKSILDKFEDFVGGIIESGREE